MSQDTFLQISASFCAISGSPVSPASSKIYKTSLPLVTGGGSVSGFMYHCCWPCACDTRDFLKVDTKTLTTKAGSKGYYVAVVGDPCKNPSKISASFLKMAPEITCENGKLRGATYSDGGFVILSLYFTAKGTLGIGSRSAVVSAKDVKHDITQSSGSLATACSTRAKQGFQSGMGKIFRQLATMTPITPSTTPKKTVQTQTVTMPNVASYNTDAKLKRACELGYGKALGIVSCGGNSCHYAAGCSVSSQASRRSATITFTATIVGIPTPKGKLEPEDIAAGISGVISVDDGLKSVKAPALKNSDGKLVKVTKTTEEHSGEKPQAKLSTKAPTAAEEDSDNSSGAIAIACSLVGAVMLLGIVGFTAYKCREKRGIDSASVVTHEQQPSAVLVDVVPRFDEDPAPPPYTTESSASNESPDSDGSESPDSEISCGSESQDDNVELLNKKDSSPVPGTVTV